MLDAKRIRLNVAKKIAVTGATGFVGAKLADKLDARVVPTTLGDIPDGSLVFHLSAPANLGVDFDLHACVAMDLEVLKICNQRGMSLVYASSNTIYPLMRGASTGDPVRPRSAYALGKALGELAYLNALPAGRRLILRVADVLGVGQRRSNLGAALENSIRTSSPLEIWGRGLKMRSYIYVDDLIDLCRTISDRSIGDVDPTGSGILNICYDAEVTVASLVHAIAEKAGLKVISRPIDNDFSHLDMRSMSPSRIPDYEFPFGLDAGLGDFVEKAKQ